MTQLKKVIHQFDDGTETVYEFNPGQVSPADREEVVEEPTVEMPEVFE